MKDKKMLGIILIILSILMLGCFAYFTLHSSKSKGTTNSTKNEKTTEDVSEERAEENDGNMTMEEWQESGCDTERIPFSYNESFQIKGLNEEVLSLVNDDKQGLSEGMQRFLYEEITEKYTSATFNNIVSINYKKNQVTMAFDIDAEVKCFLQAVYDRNTKKWTFYDETY